MEKDKKNQVMRKWNFLWEINWEVIKFCRQYMPDAQSVSTLGVSKPEGIQDLSSMSLIFKVLCIKPIISFKIMGL